MADEFEELQERLGVFWRDRGILQQALVHRSYLNEVPGTKMQSNERLEFLGDAVLGYVVALELFRRFPKLPEGDLTAMRAQLVKTSSLGKIARQLDIGKYLYLGRGEEASGGRQRAVILGRAFEAIIGALLVDQGLDAAHDFILRTLGGELEALEQGKLEKDFKSRLQEYTQSRLQLTPAYRTVAATGPDHDKRFTVEALIGDEVVGVGSGRSKQDAEQDAAEQAYIGLLGEDWQDKLAE